MATEDATKRRATEFGRQLHRIRRDIFGESLRPFAKRIGLSASYVGKLENGEVNVPRRDTILEIAERLELPADDLLTRAGYLPDRTAESGTDAYLRVLIRGLTEEQRQAVIAYIQHVRDYDIRADRQIRG